MMDVTLLLFVHFLYEMWFLKFCWFLSWFMLMIDDECDAIMLLIVVDEHKHKHKHTHTHIYAYILLVNSYI